MKEKVTIKIELKKTEDLKHLESVLKEHNYKYEIDGYEYDLIN